MLTLIRDQQHNPPLALLEVAEPEPSPCEALIEVHASSINRGELALLAARPDGWRPGQDIAAVVAQPAASGGGPAAGARVLGIVEGAGWSQRGGGTGGRVTAVSRDPSRATQLVEDGADRVLTGDEDPASAAFDVVLDGVGGASLERAVRAIRPEGTIVLYGATESEPAKLTLLQFIGQRAPGFSPTSPMPLGNESSIGADLATLAELVARRELRPDIGTVVDWREADRALTALTSGQVAGKAVLTISRNRPG